MPFILMGAWIQASSSGSLPLDQIQVAQYFICVFLVRQLTAVWVIWEFEIDVNRGNFSNRLLLPQDPMWRYLAEHVAERLARLPFSAALVGLFFALYPDAFFLPTLAAVVAGGGAILAAFIVRFVIQYTFSMLSFWTERASSAETLWNLPYLFLSGLIAPLEMFPESIASWVMWTPFPYLVYVPAQLLLGQSVDVTQGLLVLSIWGGLFWCLNRIAWRRGLKHYSAMGA